MLSPFRKLRQGLTAQSKFVKYIFYAIGEIVLVVIGILIALYINNQSDASKTRANEIRYLNNLKRDLNFNIAEIDKYIATRTQAIESSKMMLEYFDGKKIEDANAFFELGMPVYNWQRFYQNNNTFQELTSSGNLALISNDSVKTLLYNLETIYKVNKAEEDHFRFDTEVLIYTPVYEILDLKPAFESYGFNMSVVKPDKKLIPEMFSTFVKSRKLKNGFTLTILEFSTMNEQLTEMQKMSQLLVRVIDREIGKG